MGDGREFKLSTKILGVSTGRKKHVLISLGLADNIVVLTVFLAE